MVKFVPVIHFMFLLLANRGFCQRIGSFIRPHHYDLVFLPTIGSNYNRLCGHVFLDVESNITTHHVILNELELDILDISIQLITDSYLHTNTSDIKRLKMVEDMCFTGHFEEKSNHAQSLKHNDSTQQFSVFFKEPLIQNLKYRIGILYVGKIMDSIQGFFAVNLKNDNSACNNARWFGGTQLEPIHARRVFPCFDEPSFKATFDITIGHHRSLTAISNMPEVSLKRMSSIQDWRWTKFERSPPMSTYLVAMFVTDYNFVERIHKTGDRTVRMRFWGRSERIPYFNHISEMAPKVLNYLESYVKQPFSLPKLDFMPIPSPKFFAMENWGLITLDEKYLFYNEDTDSQRDLFEDYQVLVHELAHQFFGNLVTSDWWSDIWFNEGFCKRFEVEVVQQLIPSMELFAERAWATSIHTVMKVEEYHSKQKLVRHLETAEEIEAAFDTLTYDKGNAILLMLRNAVGHTHFRNAIITYMERFQFKATNSYHFIEILNDLVHQNRDDFGRGLNLTAFMESWMVQPLYPIIRCNRIGVDGRIELSQSPFPKKEQFSIEQSLNGSSNNMSWWIPISMTDATRPDFEATGTAPRLWLTPHRPSVVIPYFPASVDPESNWVIINSQMSTYARVLYDEANWKLIGRQLLLNHTVIPRVTRTQLIDDAFSLAAMDLLDYQIVMDLVEYTTVVQDDFAASTILFYINFLKSSIKENQYLYSLIENYSKRLLVDPEKVKLYNPSIRFKEGLKNDPGCKNWDDGLCIEKTLRLFNSLLDDAPERIIPFQDKSKMIEDLERHWCVAIRHGGRAEWEKAWEASLSNRWLSQRTKILSSMSCSEDRDRLKQLLSRVFDSALDQDPKDTFITIEKVAENLSGRSIGLDFVLINWNVLEKHFRNSDEILRLLKSVTKDLSSTDALEKVSRFLQKKVKAYNNSHTTVQNEILYNIRQNIERTNKHTI